MGSGSNQSGQREAQRGASKRPFRTQTQAHQWFSLAGWALIGTVLNTILFTALPLKLAEPAWQLKMIGQILASSSFLLLGVLLVCWAGKLNSEDRTLRERTNLVRIFAGWFAVFLLLCLPLQVHAGIRALREVEALESQGISDIRKSIQIIKTITNEADLRGYLGSLPNQPPLPARFDAPFPVIKQRGLTNLTASLNAATTRADLQRGQRWQTFIAEATRNGVHALLMAIAFNGIGIGRKGAPTMLQSLLPKGTFGGLRQKKASS